MAEAGCELIERPVGRAAMLTGVLGQLKYYHGLIGRVARAMDEHRPALHVPVDSPALNWHLAKAARRRGVPVVYYIAPQTWAWAPWRVRKLRRLANAVACILPFEEGYFRQRGVNAHYVGHPSSTTWTPPTRPTWLRPVQRGSGEFVLLPGSREHEIRAHTPALAEIAGGWRDAGRPHADLRRHGHGRGRDHSR